MDVMKLASHYNCHADVVVVPLFGHELTIDNSISRVVGMTISLIVS